MSEEITPPRRGRPPGSKNKVAKKVSKKAAKKAVKKVEKRAAKKVSKKTQPKKAAKKASKKAPKRAYKKTGRKVGRPRKTDADLILRNLVPVDHLPGIELPEYPEPPDMPSGAGSLRYGTGIHHLGLRVDDELMRAYSVYAAKQRCSIADAERFAGRCFFGLSIYAMPPAAAVADGPIDTPSEAVVEPEPEEDDDINDDEVGYHDDDDDDDDDDE